MKLVVSASLIELLVAVGSGLASTAFAVFGAILEHAAIESLVAGQVVLGAWEAGVGGLALIVGLYLIGYGEFLPRAKRLRAGRARR